MRHLLVVLLLTLLLCLLATSLVAQETVTATPQPAEPVYFADGLYTIDETVIIGALFIVAALIGVILAALVALYRSAPAWMAELVKPLAEIAQQQMDALVKATPNDIDDELWARIKERLQREFGALVAKSVIETDAAMYQKPNASAETIPPGN